MYGDDDLDLSDIGAEIFCADEVTKQQIKQGLFIDGTWRIHCVDSQGRYWFIRSASEPEATIQVARDENNDPIIRAVRDV